MAAELSASLEDYLELICNLIETSKDVKASEIAKKLNISRASVSEALMKLADKKLVVYESRKGIIVTPEGLKKAQTVIEKHNTFTNLFEEVLGFERAQAEETACKIEHVIDDCVFQRIKQFLQFCTKNEKFIQDFKKENNY